MKFIVNFFRKLWFKLFPKAEVNTINKKLAQAVIDKKKNQIKLLRDIEDYMLNTLKIKKESKFIPLSLRDQACKKVNKHFGKRMKELSIKININLQLVKL